ncbi:Uncharacterised protein [[Clostridium] sordellii]|nr:Uncharacterised protein [[Clostridium] sordellii] [Paeniclostridium sordellii]
MKVLCPLSVVTFSTVTKSFKDFLDSLYVFILVNISSGTVYPPSAGVPTDILLSILNPFLAALANSAIESLFSGVTFIPSPSLILFLASSFCSASKS